MSMQVLAVLFGSLGVQLLAQSPQSSPDVSAKTFAGSWSAQHKGTRYVVLEIKHTQPVSGNIKTGSVNADEEGNVSEVSEEALTSKDIIDPKIVKRKLVFKTKDVNGELTAYEMTVTERDKALLRIAEMPIKPFVLMKDR